MLCSNAVVSECGQYRYELTRIWDETSPACAFIMLNPSTADASKDDPTIRRVMRFGRDWGYGGVNVYNLFAFRATEPAELFRAKSPDGPDNESFLARIPETALVIAAWGCHGGFRGRDRTISAAFGDKLKCLGVTKDGYPRHPLYVPADRKPVPFTYACPQQSRITHP